MAFFGKLLSGKIDFSYNVCLFLGIFTFLVHFHVHRGSVFGHVSDIFGIRWDFLGTPANHFADFGGILAIFDHFWAEKKMAFVAEKWHFGPGIRAESKNPRIRKSV